MPRDSPSLLLGADGVLVGTRLWASREALVHPGHHRAILETDGDGALRTSVADIARQIEWPSGFTARIRRNAFTDRWHGREEELERQVAVEGPRYRQASAAVDPENTGVWFGEAAGLVDSIEPAAEIVARLVGKARGNSQCVRGNLSEIRQLEPAMSRSLEVLAEEILNLPTEDRSKLLDRVVASLDADRRRDRAWDALAARRDAEIEAGEEAVVAGPEVLKRLRSELK